MPSRKWNNPVAEVVERDGSTALELGIASVTNQDTRQAGRLTMPRGKVMLSRPIAAALTDGLQLEGSSATQLVYSGPPDVDSIIAVRNTRATTLREFTLTTTVPVKQMLTVESDRATTVANITPSRVTIQDVILDAAGQAQSCLDFNSPTDTNNEHGRMVRVIAHNYLDHGFGISHSQSKRHHFEQCDARYGKYGVWANRGSFNWVDGFMAQNSAQDFFLGEPYEGCSIDGHDSEGSNQLLGTRGPDGGVMIPASFRRTRFATSNLSADGIFAWYLHPGPLSFTDCDFELQLAVGAKRPAVMHLAYSDQCLTSAAAHSSGWGL